ncbi:MAG TPA: M23 family metallopeptidase, partial [Actinomycetota bacterium]|nr:M23 family metallopeptidase [Actinomycetota bacterium]
MNRWWKTSAAVLSLSGVALWVVGLVAFRPAEPAGSVPRPSPRPSSPPSPHPSPLPVFAVGDRVRLRLPASSPVAVAFHEASYRDAVRLRPLGVCKVCRNRWKFTPPPPVDRSLSYVVMDTRGRSQAATSAVDVVVRRGGEIMSPVDGVVRRIKRYRLYGRYRDVRVELRPEGVRRRRVVMLHLSHVRLRRGDRVEASVTRIGRARKLPFESQVDRYVPGR